MADRIEFAVDILNAGVGSVGARDAAPIILAAPRTHAQMRKQSWVVSRLWPDGKVSPWPMT